MATREFIQKRIEGKQREIAKLTAKLERISKAEATGWTVNPYGYYEHDKKYTLKDLEEAQASLANYQAQLAQAEEKHEKPRRATNTQTTSSYSDKSIEELKSILASLGGSCKVYDNEKIYRMRLIMAIKKVG